MKRDRFNTSDYSADNVYGMPLANKKVPGLMKKKTRDSVRIRWTESEAVRSESGQQEGH